MTLNPKIDNRRTGPVSAVNEILEIKNIVLGYGDRRVVDGLSLALPNGSIGCLLGPSGCGKTTVFRAIAGFEPLWAGQIRIKGEIASDIHKTLAPEKRNIGMVFQENTLFPHLTVSQNITFGLRKKTGCVSKQRVEEWLDGLHLNGLRDAFPHELSGGQSQRVALARALAPNPDMILLDEPFSNLDPELRDKSMKEVRDILKQYHVTALVITHDQYEAFAMADEVGVMNAGIIQQWTSAYDLYHRPASSFVADFIGQGVFLPAEVIDEHSLRFELGTVGSKASLGFPSGSRVDLLVRPDDIVHDDESDIKAEVLHRTFRGAFFLYTLRLESGCKVLSMVASHHDHSIGSKIGIRPEFDHLICFQK